MRGLSLGFSLLHRVHQRSTRCAALLASGGGGGRGGGGDDVRRKLHHLRRAEFLDAVGGIISSVPIPGVATAADTAEKTTTESLHDSSRLMSKMEEVFPGALSNKELIRRLKRALTSRGFRRESTLVATSLCCDELTRELEDDLSHAFGGRLYFRLGGLAGFPSAGVTGFGAMSAHIPDDTGACLIVYGPHCGMDGDGRVGTVPRRGKLDGGTCCGSAIAATEYVLHNSKPPAAIDPLDVQQASVVAHLQPYAERVRSAFEPMAEVPYCLYEAQDKLIHQIVSRARGGIDNHGPLAMLGGIEINTPPSEQDFFLPLRFDLYESINGQDTESLMSELAPRPDLRP